MRLHHDGSELFLEERHDCVCVRLWTDGSVLAAYLRTVPDGEEFLHPMHSRGHGWWEVHVEAFYHVMHYRFVVVTSEGNWHYGGAAPTRHVPTDQRDFRYLSWNQLPCWVLDRVFYQILPDRFQGTGLEGPCPDEFYGGDLAGTRARLAHVHEVGANAVYLNPIFTSPSYHRYDVTDYRHVCPRLGGNEAFAGLMAEVKHRDLKLILDFVPNHCSAEHPWFRQAQADPQSPYAEFFTFHHHPDEFETWQGYRHMPKLDYRSDRLRKEMLSNLRLWLQDPYAIDGWRLDVAHMLGRQGQFQSPHAVVRNLRDAVKAENPQAYLLGEHRYDASHYLQGNELDASLNYGGFTLPCLHWLCGRDMNAWEGSTFGDTRPLDGRDMVSQWRDFMSCIPWQVAQMQFNMLGNHDTPRIRTLLEKDEGKMAAALTLLFTFPGVPSIYYGDEVGMLGGKDPENRAPMQWDRLRWDDPTWTLTQRLARLRTSSRALARGGFEVLACEPGRVVYRRMARGECLLVDVSREAGPPLKLPKSVGELTPLLASGRPSRELPGRARAGAEIYREGGGVWSSLPELLETAR